MSFASLEGKTALVTGASRGIGRAIAHGARPQPAPSVVVGYRSGKDEAEALAAEIGGARRAGRRLERRGRGAARRGGRRPRHPRQQRRAHARRPARAHVRRRLARRDRDEPLVRLLHLPRGLPADDEEARGRDRQHLVDRGRARQLGPDELRGVEGRDHRLHEVARARARQPRRPRQRRRPRLREDAAHRRPAGGGDRRDAPEHAARAARGAGGHRRRGTLPLLRRGRRSSRARCCSSTADWGCR